MKAAVFFNCGDASQIRIAEVPEPQIDSEQILLRISASAFNHLELWSLHGPADDSYHFPMWTGSDIAGVIETLGTDVTGWSIGEAVVVNPSLSCGKCSACLRGDVTLCNDYDILGSNGHGGNAEYIAVNADKLLRMPAGFDIVTAAAAPLAYQTAWRALITRANLQAGEDVLILGASGGVAVAAIQISKMLGARVFAVTSSKAKMNKARAAGADFALDRTQTNPFEEVRRIIQGRGVDLVVENVGAQTWGETLCDYNGETTPSNNLEYMAEEKMACLRIQMVRSRKRCPTPRSWQKPSASDSQLRRNCGFYGKWMPARVRERLVRC